MPRCVRLAFLLAVLLLAFPPSAAALPVPDAVVSVAGSVPDAVRLGLARRLTPTPPGQPLRLAVVLAPRNERALDALLAAIYDPRSPMYHRYLTPATVRALFGPDRAAVADLATWLRSQGLRPLPWDGDTILDVTGSAAAVGAAFHVGLWRYRLPAAPSPSGVACASPRPPSGRHGAVGGACVSPAPIPHAAGRTGMAPDRDPSLPARFASLVRGIVGLDSMGRAVAQALATRSAAGGPTRGYTPSQIAAAYDFRPLYAAGYHGEHTRVALIELAPYDPADIAAYAGQFKVAPAITDYTVDSGNAGAPAAVEATMDIELLSAAVPGAAIDVYDAPNDNPTTDPGTGLLDAYNEVAGGKDVQALALTWVYCEPSISPVSGFIGAEHTIFKVLAVEGTTVLGATGDAGAYGCSDPTQPGGPGDTQPAVSIPSSDPYVLAVGATDLTLAGQGGGSSIAAEVAWSCTVDAHPACGQLGVKGGGSGGGLSQVFRDGDPYGDDLSWQTGPGVDNAYSDGFRQVPDVSLSGSYGITSNHQYSIYYQGQWQTGGGTSAATPWWAALILLADQYLIAHGDAPLGWVNPQVYQLGAAVQPFPPYHDIVSGDNLLYPATPGWDYASGWGSPDARNFVCDMGAYGLPATPTPTQTTPPPAATPPVTATPTSSPGLTPFATATGTPPPTPTQAAGSCDLPAASPTPRPSATPACPSVGIGNGDFATGTLACWIVNSGLLPRISAAMHLKSRYSAQLGSDRTSQIHASVLRQTFTVPPGLAHPVLHFSYWLARIVPRAAAPSGQCRPQCQPTPGAAPPLLTIFGPRGRVLVRTSFLPRRDRTWSGFALPLPSCGAAACAARLELALEVPPQPKGVNEVLYLDDVRVGP